MTNIRYITIYIYRNRCYNITNTNNNRTNILTTRCIIIFVCKSKYYNIINIKKTRIRKTFSYTSKYYNIITKKNKVRTVYLNTISFI